MTRTLVWNFINRQVWCALLTLLPVLQSADIPPKRFAVQLSAVVQESPPKISLVWPGDTSNGYQVSRRTLDSGWSVLGNLGGGSTSFDDSNVTVGNRYEYKVVKDMGGGLTGYGYIQVAIKAPLADSRGKVIVLVENNIANALGGELSQFQRNLVGDGWTVLRSNVSANDSPANVKNIIRNHWNADQSGVKAVILVGHVPVPYSGDIFPDGHENHQGAWPADVYYGEMNGNWTDSSVNTRVAEREVNWNVPGDGKFDQSKIPSPVELTVGRVDFFNMTCFANKNPSRSEVDLTRAYFNKNHNWRHGQIRPTRGAIICDNFSDKGKDPIAGSAWRNFPGFFGADKIHEVGWDQFLPNATANSYLWSYASGGGSYYYSMGVGTSDDLALKDLKVVFAMFMGSYFGDWNNESNFMRASLGSGTVLTATYSGFPHYLYFPMALGGTVGEAVRLSQNNFTNTLYAPWVQGWSEVHMSLLGDPTLRMHPVLPPSGLNVSVEPGKANLTWSASADSALVGYHVYRATSAEGPFTRVTSSPVGGTSHSDSAAAGTYTYMVRAIKLEQSASGSYYNSSQGAVINATVPPGGGGTVQAPAVPSNFRVVGSTTSSVDLAWNDVANEDGYKLEQRQGTGSWIQVRELGPNATAANLNRLDSATQYSFRIRSFNTAGHSAYSGEITATTGTTLQPPGVPANLRALEVTSTSIKVGWDVVSGADGYTIGWRPISQPTATYVEIAGGNNTTFERLNLSSSTEYVFHVRSKNSVGSSSYGPELRVTTQAQLPAAASVTFLGLQLEGGGNWPDYFGTDGYLIPNGAQKLPSYATVTLPDGAAHTWSLPTSDSRAPIQDPTRSTRIASAYYGSPLRFEVNVSGADAQDVTLYCLDWDGARNQQTVEVIDVVSGRTLHSQPVESFNTGKYLKYRIKGHVRFSVSGSPNGVISAILFGTRTATPINDPIRLQIVKTPAGLSMTITGSSGQGYVVEKSRDFTSWTTVSTGQLSGTSATFNLDWTPNEELSCFRVKAP